MGQKILIVEDEAIVGLDLSLQLQDEGFECLGPARTVEEAVTLIDTGAPDFTVLDANLNGTPSIDVAQRLKDRGMPFVYVSGYGEHGTLEGFPSGPLISKPLRFERLLALVRETLLPGGAALS